MLLSLLAVTLPGLEFCHLLGGLLGLVWQFSVKGDLTPDTVSGDIFPCHLQVGRDMVREHKCYRQFGVGQKCHKHPKIYGLTTQKHTNRINQPRMSGIFKVDPALTAHDF